MTNGDMKVAILATFGCLAIFYPGSVLFQVSSLGWVWVRDAVHVERLVAYSLALRIIGGTISLIVFALVFAGSRSEKLRVSLAWILAFGVAIIVVMDNLLIQSDPLTSRALVWLIAAAIIGVHFFGAIVAQRGMAK